MTVKIALLREEKLPADKRVAFTPAQCSEIKNKYPNIEFYVQPSAHRCFSDDAYQKVGAIIQEDISHCDFLLGIKEVPVDCLLPNKHYLFFSHTIKKQAHNQALMKAMVQKNITLTDYETLRWKSGDRILGFGRFAGVVGAYNGLLTWGKKFDLYQLKPAYLCEDFNEVKQELKKIKLSPIKIILTGNGRVSLGALELLKEAGIKEVTPSDFLTKRFAEPVFAVLLTENLYERIDGKPYDRSDFHHDPTRYRCVFRYYLPHCDLLMNGIYWDSKMDRLFSENDTRQPTFGIKVIADISCDVNGSVPITLKDTKIDDPVFGYNPQTMQMCEPYQKDCIDIMAVSNLPTELPKDASEGFGEMLMEYVLPELLKEESAIIHNASILVNGKLTNEYAYLADYAY
ncbi:MAG: NAD(P)-dependent oxidoreductase [Bacteroidota bacterium]|nr:NAD(P)-dependent oxidoreductase [Bacteroidota bacterium]